MDGDRDPQCERSRRQWSVIENHFNPLDELVRLYADTAIARARVEEALQQLARRHRIRSDRIVMAMDRYAAHLLDVVVGELKSQLSGDLETQSSLSRRATAIPQIQTLALPTTGSVAVLCSSPGRPTGVAVSGRAVLPAHAEPVPLGGPTA
jgi:hypothetical protein